MKKITILLVALLFVISSQLAAANGTLKCSNEWLKTVSVEHIERNVTVSTENGLAFMELEDVFENSSGISCEGIYRFKLPAGGFTTGFWINTDEKNWVKGEVKEITQARKIYQTITSRMVDPGLLEQKDDEITIRIFPIEANKKAGIKFRFFFPETGLGSKCKFEFPVGFNIGEGMNQKGSSKPVEPVKFKFIAAFKDTDGIKNLNCSLPAAKIISEEGKNNVSFEGKVLEQSDILVSYDLKLPKKTSVSLYQLPTGKKFSLIRLSGIEMNTQPPDSMIALIVDTSGSMGAKNKERAINACKIIEGIAGLKSEIFALNEPGIRKASITELQSTSFYGPTIWKGLEGFVDKGYAGIVLITDADDLRSNNLKTIWEKIAKKPVWILALGRNYEESISCMAQVYGGATFIEKSLNPQQVTSRIQSAISFIQHSPNLYDQNNKKHFPLFGSMIGRAYYVLPFVSGDYSARDSSGKSLLSFNIADSGASQKVTPWFVSFAARQQIRGLEAMEQTPRVRQRITELGIKYSQTTYYTAFLAVPDDIARANADVMHPAYLAIFAAPNFRKARSQARQKVCYSNLRVLSGATEMYFMEHEDMDIGHDMQTGTFDMDRLVKGHYLKSQIHKPIPECDYRIIGNFAKDGFFVCLCHGSVDEPGLSIDELITRYCAKNGLNPDDFCIPDDLFGSDSGEYGFDTYMRKMEPLIIILMLLL